MAIGILLKHLLIHLSLGGGGDTKREACKNQWSIQTTILFCTVTHHMSLEGLKLSMEAKVLLLVDSQPFPLEETLPLLRKAQFRL